MGFWDVVGDILASVLNTTSKVTNDFNDRIEPSYERNSRRFEKMSDEQLKREINRMKTSSGGSSFENIGKYKAMKEEIDKRRK